MDLHWFRGLSKQEAKDQKRLEEVRDVNIAARVKVKFIIVRDGT